MIAAVAQFASQAQNNETGLRCADTQNIAAIAGIAGIADFLKSGFH